MLLYRAIALVTFFFGALLNAQEGASIVSYTLDTLTKHALSKNGHVLSKVEQVNRSKAIARQAGAWPNPSISILGGIKTDNETLGPVVEVSLSQNFSVPKKLQLRGEVAGFDAMLREIELLEAELTIISEAIRLAYTYAIQQRKVTYAKNRNHRFQLLQSYLASHTFVSPQQMTTSFIVKERLRNLIADEKRLDGELSSTLEKLNLFIGTAHQSPALSLPWLKGKRTLLVDEWVKKAVANNASLKSQQLAISKATAESALQRREAWPDFTVSAFFSQESTFSTERIFGLGIGLPLPIFNRNQGAIQAASHNISSETNLYEYQKRKIIAYTKSLLAEYAAARAIVENYPESSIAKLDANIEVMEREFRKNRIDFLLFLELDTQGFDSITHILDAQLALVDIIVSLFFVTRDQTILTELSTF